MRRGWWGLASLCAFATSSSSGAAVISVEGPNRGNEITIVSVDGDLSLNDDDLFQAKTSALSKALVVLRSDGGNLVAGIRIGEAIRLKGFSTLVVERCASACALAWLGGTQRFMSAQARIGFHAASNSKSGRETGGRKRHHWRLPEQDRITLRGRYLYHLRSAQVSMTWVALAEAKRNGIDVTLLKAPLPEPRQAQPPTVQPQLPSNEALKKSVAEFVISLFANWSAPNAQALKYLSGLYRRRRTLSW